jgi:signal transduction histidine kinase
MKLTLRFVVLIAALLLSVAASAGAGWHALRHLDAALDGVVKGDMERLLAITHTRRLFRSLVVLERDYLLSNADDERQAMDHKVTAMARELEQQLEKYATLMPPSDAPAIAAIRGAQRRWLERDARVRAAARRSSAEGVALAASHARDPVSWEAVIGGLVKANEARLAREVDGTHATYATARTTLLAVSFAAALLAASLGYLIFSGIRKNVRQLSQLNGNLEGLVAQRTAELSERERSLRLVLDSTGDGVIGVQSDGGLAGNASAAAAHWFGPVVPGTAASRYLFPDDAASEALFRLGLAQLLDGSLPRPVVLDQMPQRVLRDGLILDLSYRQVLGDSTVTLLVLVRDVTARVNSEHGEQEARERQGLVGKLLIDKLGFANFVRDTERLIRALESERDERVARQHLHTLKGNVAVYGLGSMARLCHKVEDRLAETPGLPSAAEIAALSAMLRDKLKGIEDFLTGLGRDVYEVETEEHAAVVQSLLDRKDYEEILEMVEIWTWPRVAERLTRARAECEYLARRLDKQVLVEVEHGDLRLPAGYLEHFWPALTHVLRNAVGHGLETPEQRVACGKPPRGSLRLTAKQADECFVLQVEDDGAGIQLGAIKASARARGLSWHDEREALELIFRDGVSSQAGVTELSGRGVGLAAVRAACEAAQGRIEVVNRPGHGVRLVFSFPRPLVDTAALAAKLAQRWMVAPSSSATSSMTLRKAGSRLAL